ncbi:uncharacterized protein LOC125422670 [Ziziphus jujuba]|uniref:Uncharacterized protein LOC125422670 n=1 Tax=Ziziphus jujuba TaxID=326968 RepID=A0ABM3IL08_ZIZJJ|nr:uncharacterized protein LOC125422670 [Ziziphus jujuba]
MDVEGDLSNENWWKHLWRSKIHERTKFFLWNLANEGLPVLNNLIARGMSLENLECGHGCQSSEIEIHLFFHYEIAKRLWNQIVHKGSVDNIEVASTVVMKRFQELKEAISREEPVHIPRTSDFALLSHVWRRPLEDVIKLNIDVAIRNEGSHLAVVARNSRGKVLHIQAFNSAVNIPETAELEAILKAMQVAKNFSWSSVQFESDTLNVIRALQDKDITNLHWTAEPFFHTISLYLDFFSNFSFWPTLLANG